MPASRQRRFRQPTLRGEGVPVTQNAETRLGLLMGGALHLLNEQGARRFDLCVLDLDEPGCALTVIPMEFFGHGIAPDPVRPGRISMFEKRGKGACEIDLQAGAVTRPIETAANRQFYGHGAYSPDGRLLYCTETIVEGDFDGVIVVRDVASHAELGRFPSFGASPHDCRLVDGGRTMVITNGGGRRGGIPPNVAFVDVQAEKLLEKLEFQTPRIDAGHLDIDSRGRLAVISAQRKGLPNSECGGITLRLPSGEFRTLAEPKEIVGRLLGETLSVCIHEPTNVVGCTTPVANLLTFWDLDSAELLSCYELPNPRGIELTRDGEHFAVSFGEGNPPEALCLIAAADLQRVEGYDLASTGITGSHLFSYNLPPALRG